MKNQLFCFVLLIACSSSTLIHLSPNPIRSTSLVETLAKEFLHKTKLPGLSIAVSKKGELIYAKGFGYADLEAKIPMSSDTQLRTASVAKVITATALGRLVTEEKLNIDEPIKKYIPYIDKKYANLTTRQLAGHTAGIRHRPKGNSYKRKQYNTIQESVQLIKRPLLFTPDTNYKYSTSGYNLLAAVIEGASGKKYTEYLNQEIFEPLGMMHTAQKALVSFKAKR